MFGKSKGESNPLMKMFEEVNAEDETCWELFEGKTLLEAAKGFCSLFKTKSAQWKIVWIIRILCWILLLCVAAFGLALRVKKYFN